MTGSCSGVDVAVENAADEVCTRFEGGLLDTDSMKTMTMIGKRRSKVLVVG